MLVAPEPQSSDGGIDWHVARAPARYARVAATGLRSIPHLAAFLPEADRVVFERWPAPGTDAVVGWADRPSAQWAKHVARQRGIPYLALEDGFLRSVSLGQAGAPPLSLVLDTTGMYFDARRPSDLERLIGGDGWLDAAILGQARAAITLKNRLRLSKYNDAPPLALGLKTRRRVLVIDQTAGDASIAGALATRAMFDTMLAAARADNPGAEILVKIHPATAAGYCTGCIDLTQAGNARVLADACDPIALLEQVDAVYTVSSLIGFEALLLGLPVHCFGLPFYAGWGATIDQMVSPRRSKTRSAEEIFAAAYMRYARYLDPHTGAACSVFDAMERLALFKTQARRIKGPLACYGFAPWKHAPIADVLGAMGQKVSFHATASEANRQAMTSGGSAVMWASRETPANLETLQRGGVPLLRMEDGFLRSVGLGSDFHRAMSFVLDDLGIYCDARRPSRLEALLEAGAFDDALLARAAALRGRIVAAGLSKYNLGGGPTDPFSGAGERRKVLVVGQVSDDASIRHGCEDIASNEALLAAVRAARPDAFILFKAHPDVAAGNRRGRLPAMFAPLADRVVADADIADCIDACDELHTMTSLAGFEALLREKPTHTYGRPFYAGWGLTTDRLDFPRRTRRLTLDALVAGALIAYPIYIDPRTRRLCSVEFHLEQLLQRKMAEPAPPPARGLMRSTVRYLRAAREILLSKSMMRT